MATVTGLTAERMLEIEDASVVGGSVVGTNLILHTHGGDDIDAGSITGPMGPSGAAFIICTSGTRPTLTAPEAGKVIYETDTKLVRVWTGSVWRLQERVICTHAGRPTMTSGDEGVKIYETDTNNEYIWSGSAWTPASSTAIAVVVTYADATARAAGDPTPTEGALSYLQNAPGVVWIYQSGVWNTVGPPPGTMQPFIGTTPPSSWVLMYGQTITNAQTLYPVLWSFLDATFKSGTSLIVPDLRGRIPVGKDNMGGTDAGRIGGVGSIVGLTLGSAGGSKYTQAHGHTLHDPGHSHAVGENLSGSGDWGMWSGGKAIQPNTQPSTTHITLDDYGSGTSQNVQPSIVMNWILKLL
jgi:microcystin-dependent protein